MRDIMIDMSREVGQWTVVLMKKDLLDNAIIHGPTGKLTSRPTDGRTNGHDEVESCTLTNRRKERTSESKITRIEREMGTR